MIAYWTVHLCTVDYDSSLGQEWFIMHIVQYTALIKVNLMDAEAYPLMLSICLVVKIRRHVNINKPTISRIIFINL